MTSKNGAMTASTPAQMRELADALRRDAGDYARYRAGTLPPDEVGSWDQREVRAWQAAEFIEAVGAVPKAITATVNKLLSESGHGPKSADRSKYAARLTQAVLATIAAHGVQR